MVNWAATSERNLLFLLSQSGREPEIHERAYFELKQRLQRYFHSTVNRKSWQTIRQQQDDIIAEVITRLLTSQKTLRGNSWQFRKFIRQTLFSVCATRLSQAILDQQSLDTSLLYDNEFTLLERLVDPNQVDPQQILLGLDVQRKLRLLIQQTMQQMDKRCQEMLLREYVLDQPQKLMADEMGLKHHSAIVILQRCRWQLIRQFFIVLSNQDGTMESSTVMSAIQQISDPERTLLQTWWQGEQQWSKLGGSLGGTYSLAEIKALFAQALWQLYRLLS